MKFSCVIGSHNPNREWLLRALKSAEGLFNDIVLINDGSVDNKVFIDSMCEIPEFITYHAHDVNKGFYEARNSGIRLAMGDVICSLDDDDYFDRDGVIALKKFVEENPDGDIFHFILRQFNQATDLYGGGANPEHLINFNVIPSQSWFKKKVWEDVGGFTYPLAEDWDFWLKALIQKKKFVYFPQVVYNYNRHSDSVSMNFKKSFDEMRNEILQRNNL
jgi:glycosyltransferase involved in cell wall biosynthesis